MSTKPGSPVLDPITAKPCIDAATKRPYIVGEDGKPTLAPIPKLSAEERLTRLEDGFLAFADFVCEHSRARFTRSVVASDVGVKVLEFVDAIAAERGAK